jgi:hypothetical protein
MALYLNVNFICKNHFVEAGGAAATASAFFLQHCPTGLYASDASCAVESD